MKIEYLSHFGDDLMVVNAARVSFNKWHDDFDKSKDEKLIEYLAHNKHWTPFAHPQVQLRVTVPIFVARQWFRHTIGTARNEVSRRYVDEPAEFFFPFYWRGRPQGSMKQGSSGRIEEQDRAYQILEDLTNASENAVKELLELGVAPEQARMALLQSAYTSWVETASLYYWARFCNLRLDSHAQQEIRDIALQVSKVLYNLFPISWTYLVPCHFIESI